ncbi:pyrroline-5-carboxylate reductase, partial [Penicillium cinerascens]
MRMPESTSPPSRLRITIIGCGTLGQALAHGVVKQRPGNVRLDEIVLTGRRDSQVDALRSQFPELTVTGNNCDPCIWDIDEGNVQKVHLLFLGPKPYDIPATCAQLYPAIQRQRERGHSLPVIITLCPGITIAQLQSWLPHETPLVRAMPNTPVKVSQGATGLFPSENVQPLEMELVQAVFRAISPTVVVLSQENHLDVVASISGSAPAYFFHLMDSMVEAAKGLGLPESISTRLVAQSCIGSGSMAHLDLGVSLAQMKNDVCVPGGSTRRAMDVLDANDWHRHVEDAVRVSWKANRAMKDGT